MGFRNRCQIAGADGMVNLSVPLVKGRGQKTLVRDVRISDRQPWATQHWKTIVSCYSRSPWFEHYRDGLEELYRRHFDYLLDWDRACFDWSVRVLGLEIRVGLTERWVKEYSVEEGVDWRGKMRPRDREVGAGVAGAVGGGVGAVAEAEETAGAGPGPEASSGSVRYRQVFEERTGFIPNLSILDLLFCEGRNAIKYIRSS